MFSAQSVKYTLFQILLALQKYVQGVIWLGCLHAPAAAVLYTTEEKSTLGCWRDVINGSQIGEHSWYPVWSLSYGTQINWLGLGSKNNFYGFIRRSCIKKNMKCGLRWNYDYAYTVYWYMRCQGILKKCSYLMRWEWEPSNYCHNWCIMLLSVLLDWL